MQVNVLDAVAAAGIADLHQVVVVLADPDQVGRRIGGDRLADFDPLHVGQRKAAGRIAGQRKLAVGQARDAAADLFVVDVTSTA